MADGTTEQQRLERLKGLLTGTRATTRAGRALAGVEHGNVVIGAALHAADRLRQGQPATDLEERLLGVLGAALSEEEIRAWGRVYRESVDKLGTGVAVVPASISGRPAGSGFSLSDLASGFAPVASEALAQPNMSVIDPEALAAGGNLDSAEFLAGMRDAGFGASVFARPASARSGRSAGEAAEDPTAQSRAAQAGPDGLREFAARLELESFYVVEAVGDQGGGKDEIYWCSSSGSDKTSGRSYTSQVFGGVKKGQTLTFPSGDRTVFWGSTTGSVVLAVYCWESDQSSSEWYDALQKQLNDLCTYIFSSPTWELATGVMPGADLLGLAGEAIKLGAFLMEALRNKDDLSSSRIIVLDQRDLAIMDRQGSAEFHFNGDGHHTLKINYTGAPVPFPTGTLEYAVRTGGKWGKAINLPWQTASAPALASFDGSLYAAYVDPGSERVMWTRLTDGVWSDPRQISDGWSYCAPALAVFDGRLYAAITGRDNSVHLADLQPGQDTWGYLVHQHNLETTLAPALAAYDNRLWMSTVGTDDNIWHGCCRSADGDWDWWEDSTDWTSRSPIGLVSSYAELWRMIRGEKNEVYLGSLAGAGRDQIIDRYKATAGLAGAHYQGSNWLFHRGGAGELCAAENPAWNDTTTLSPTGTSILGEPAAAVHQDKLYVMWHR
ncbi:hypothetical protein [Streptomyces sp. NPDC057939]|uniref:hypothetical protein n=1 Tax=Streptomyces sp. NPDC057939 TaxID=3346284 RepID=UPI0036E2B901